MSHTDNEKREAPCGPEMGGPELVVQFTDSLASLRLLSTSSLAIVPRDISSIAADTSASVATGTLAIAIFYIPLASKFAFETYPQNFLKTGQNTPGRNSE